jgi:hypothetical protein
VLRQVGYRHSDMRLRHLHRTAVAALAVGFVALLATEVAAARPAAAPVPTSVTLFSGPYGGKTYTGQVAVQRTPTGKTRMAGLVKGLSGKTEIGLVSTADCNKPTGPQALIGGPITSGKGFDLTGRLNGSISGHSVALFFANGTQFVCYRLPAPKPAGAAFVMTASGNPSAATTGMVTMNRRTLALGTLVLPTGSTSTLTLQPSTASCTAATAPVGKPLKMHKREAFFYADIQAADFNTYRQAHSLVFTGSSGKVGCIKWDSSVYGPLLA